MNTTTGGSMGLVRRLVRYPVPVRWVIVSVAVPAFLWVPMVVIGVVVEGPDAIITSFTLLFAWAVYVAPPLAVVALLVGYLDLRLGRAVVRERTARAVGVATGTMSGVFLVLAGVFVGFCWGGLPAAWVVALPVVLAAVPALVCWRRYVRLRRAGAVVAAVEAQPAADAARP